MNSEKLQSEITDLIQQISELDQTIRFDPYPKKKEEARQRKTKLSNKLEELRTEFEKQKQEAEKQELTKKLEENLSDIRISRQTSQLNLFQKGIITLDLLGWEKINSTKVKTTTEGSKKEIEIDLKRLPLTTLKHLFEKAYSPIIFVVEPEGILTRKGKIRGLWGHPTEYDQTVGDRQIPQTLIGLMLV